MESSRIVGILARHTGDVAVAEDLAQESLADALVSWETAGIPNNPEGWLLTVGRRRAIDAFRHRAAGDARYAQLARQLDDAAPGPAERTSRLASVLNVSDLTFTERSSASSGDAWIRRELADEARRPTRVLVRLEPEPEAFGLLALMEPTAARFPARVDGSGRPACRRRSPSAVRSQPPWATPTGAARRAVPGVGSHRHRSSR
ncbi:MAG TPA: DUF6596 domain-containing protein [Cellulomonadaceae bacterium]|nr:DUF6596 domain-containing protein [Cellulomonadaceae bacterium]